MTLWRSRRKLLLCLLMVVFLGFPRTPSAWSDEREPARVLVIHSYHKGFAWTDDIMRGMDDVFSQSGLETEIYVEHMDTKRFQPEASFAYLEEMFRRKYRRIAFDVLLLSDNNALTFVLSRRDPLFPNVPIVFCGINNFHEALIDGQLAITGVAEEIDVAGTVSLALRVMPDVRRFVVINDRTPTGRENLKKLQEATARFPDRSVSFEVLDDVTTQELQARLSGLPADAAALVFTFHRTRDGRWLSIPEYLSMIRESCPVPVFSFWSHYLGHGVLGGVMVDGEAQGKTCAEYAVRILKGESADAMPVLVKSPNVPLLDYRQLRRFSIPESRLPEGGVIVFAPSSFLKRHRTAAAAAVTGVFALIVFILFLLVNMTRRRRIENRLAESEKRYRLLAENTSDVIWTMDTDHRHTFFSPSVERLIGFRPDELLDMPLKEQLTPASFEIAEKLIAQRQKQWREGAPDNQPNRFEFEQIRKDGSTVWTEIVSNPILDEHGRPLGIVGVTRDISDRKRIERKLRESEEKFQKAFHSCPAFMSISTLDEGRFLEVNAEVLKLTGFSKDEVVGRKAADLGLWDSVGREAILMELKQKGRAHNKEVQIRSKNGEMHHLLWFGDVVSIGGRDCLVVTGYDQTDRKRAEDELLKYQQIVSTNPDAMAYLDHEYRYRIVNDAYEIFSNTKREAFLGKTVPEYLGEEIFREKIKSHFDRCLEGETIQYEEWFDYPALGRRYVQVTYFPFRDNADGISGIVANTRDITELKLAEEKIQQYAEHLEEIVGERTRELQQAQEELLIRERLAVLGHFAGSVAHEIRNPLAAIDSSVYFLKMKFGHGDEKINDHFQRIRSNIGQSTAIIQSLLNLSRMEIPKTASVDLAGLVSNALSTAKIPGTVQTRQDFPDAPLFAHIDAQQIRMALKNILQNAAQAMGGKGVLTIAAHPLGPEAVEIVITDTGPGIPPENLDKVFEPLFSTKTHGIGFGLSIARMIVERHGGRLTAEAPPEGGARFRAVLPLSGETGGGQ